MVMYDDPRILRAIAHPTRNRVLHELSASGSMRAADIAAALEIPANQASFHLRQLAKYGIVEEDPEAARDKRDRVWRLVDPDGIRFRTSDMLAQPGGAAAYEVFRRNAVAWGHHLVDRALATEALPGKSTSEWSVRLTVDEARSLFAEVEEVVERYRAGGQSHGVGEGGEERSTYSIYQLIQPYPDLPEAGDNVEA